MLRSPHDLAHRLGAIAILLDPTSLMTFHRRQGRAISPAAWRTTAHGLRCQWLPVSDRGIPEGPAGPARWRRPCLLRMVGEELGLIDARQFAVCREHCPWGV